MRAGTIALLAFALLPFAAGAESVGAPGAAAAQAPRPCRDAPGYGDFDFWIGSWVVHDAEGTLAGRNRIVRAEGGCRLDEHWRGAAGGTGSSFSFHDPVDGGWEQVWHSPGGAFIRIRGGLVDDASMLLEGTIHYVAAGRSAPFRGRWTPLPDGRVRQFFEEYSAGTGRWQPWFEGFYSRTDAGSDPSNEGDRG